MSAFAARRFDAVWMCLRVAPPRSAAPDLISHAVGPCLKAQTGQVEAVGRPDDVHRLAVGQAQNLDSFTGTFAHIEAPLSDCNAPRLVEFARAGAYARIIEFYVRKSMPVGTFLVQFRRGASSAKGPHQGPSAVGKSENLYLMVILVRYVDEVSCHRKRFWVAQLFRGAHLSSEAVAECARVCG